MSNLSLNFQTRTPLFGIQKELPGVSVKTTSMKDVDTSHFSGDIGWAAANGYAVKMDITKYDAGETPETTLANDGTPIETGSSLSDSRMAIGTSLKMPISSLFTVGARANYYNVQVGYNKESCFGLDVGAELHLENLSISLSQANILSNESKLSLEKTINGNAIYKMGKISALAYLDIESTNAKFGGGVIWDVAPNLSVNGSIGNNGINTGVGYKIDDFRIDYKLSMNEMFNQSMISLSYQFSNKKEGVK